MRGRIHAHRALVAVLVGDFLIHLEQVAVTFTDGIFTKPLDRVGKIQVYTTPTATDAATVIALLLGGTGSDITWCQVSVGGILALQIIITVIFSDLIRMFAAIFLLLWNPYATVVPERLGHQGQLGLVVACLRDAGRVNLGVAGVGKESAFFVGFPVGRNRAPHGVGGEIENVDVPACAKADGVGSITLHLAGYQVAHRDAARHAVDDNQIEHFAAVIHLDRAGLDLAGKSGVSAQQELLAGLATREERTGNLGTAEGAVVKVAGIVAGKGHALCDTLVDDVVGHLGKTPYVSLAGTEVAHFDGVVEQTIDRI